MFNQYINKIRNQSAEQKQKFIKELKPYHLYFFMTCVCTVVICIMIYILRNNLLSENLVIKQGAITILVAAIIKSIFNVITFGTISSILFSIYRKYDHFSKKKRDWIYTISTICLIAMGFAFESIIFQKSNSEKMIVFIDRIVSERLK